MFCPVCGKENAPQMSFCISCGKRLPTNAPPPAPAGTKGATFGNAVLGFFKVIGSFFTLPATSLVDVYKELAKVGAKKGAFSMEATPTPFLSWILIASRMLVPVFAIVWVLLMTLGGLWAGKQENMWGEPQHWWSKFGSHLGSGLGAFIAALIGAFFFIWFANYCLDLLSIIININQRVTDISKDVRNRAAGDAA